MQKIASPHELQSELRRLLATCRGPKRPSRETLAKELLVLANRLATKEYLWEVSLMVTSPSRPNLKNQRQYKVKAENKKAAVEEAKKLSKKDGHKFVDVVSVLKKRAV
jgi:hypothetical protein